jgi:hypothetical protein
MTGIVIKGDEGGFHAERGGTVTIRQQKSRYIAFTVHRPLSKQGSLINLIHLH